MSVSFNDFQSSIPSLKQMSATYKSIRKKGRIAHIRRSVDVISFNDLGNLILETCDQRSIAEWAKWKV